MKGILSIVMLMCIVGGAFAATCCPSSSQSCPSYTYNTIFPMNPSGCTEMPRVPMTFGGCVYIDNIPAPVGTIIEVRGTNVKPNSIILGSYCFGQGTFDEKLTAQGTPAMGGMVNIPEGSTLSFYVNGIKCKETASYHSGHHLNMNFHMYTC